MLRFKKPLFAQLPLRYDNAFGIKNMFFLFNFKHTKFYILISILIISCNLLPVTSH